MTSTSILNDVLVFPPPPRAPVMQNALGEPARLYWDRSHYSSPAEQMKALSTSATLYVGNLSFTTRSGHVTQHFQMLGLVKRVVMGLDRMRKTPCGFCFVEFSQRAHAMAAVSLLSGTKLDGKVIRVELDAGFQPGRQYGRGVSGGQVRDDVAKRANNINADGKRRRSEGDATKPVTLDGALPSARQQLVSDETHYGPTTGGLASEGPNDAGTEKMDEDDAAPSAKRQKTQE